MAVCGWWRIGVRAHSLQNAATAVPLYSLERTNRYVGTDCFLGRMGLRSIFTAVCRLYQPRDHSRTGPQGRSSQPYKPRSVQRYQNRQDKVKQSGLNAFVDQPHRTLIWEGYKRNHKGAIPPAKTRLKCKRGPAKVSNPCPICKNDIEIQYTDTKLLEQFICPHTGQILKATKTGLCRQQQKKLVAAINKAWDHGLLLFNIPRKFSEEGIRIPPWNKIDVL